MSYADDIANNKEEIYPIRPIPEGHIFKLTKNNVELSLYFSIRHFNSQLTEHQKGGRFYGFSWSRSWRLVCSQFLNELTFLRPFLFQDRFLSVKRNKYKFLYLLILYIIVVEYYIPTFLISNTLL